MSSYEHFTNIYDIPYTIVASVFIVAKLILLCCKWICWSCKYACWCCKCFSCRTSSTASTNCTTTKYRKLTCCCRKFPYYYRKLTCWMLRIIFADSEGFTELRANSENEDTTSSDNTKKKNNAYINGVSIQNKDVPVFSILLLCYSLLILLIMYSTYLLDVSFTCTEDPAIYCFPQLLGEDDPDNPIITTEVRDTKITDCSEWTNSNVSDKVGFNCYRYAFNGQEALVVGGGLLAIFTISTRMIVSFMINIHQFCDERAGKKCKANRAKCCKITRREILKIIYSFLALINIAVFLVIIIITFENYSDNLSRDFAETDAVQVAQQVSDYVRDNGIQTIIILSTVELLLVIDWDHYTNKNAYDGTEPQLGLNCNQEDENDNPTNVIAEDTV